MDDYALREAQDTVESSAELIRICRHCDMGFVSSSQFIGDREYSSARKCDCRRRWESAFRRLKEIAGKNYRDYVTGRMDPEAHGGKARSGERISVAKAEEYQRKVHKILEGFGEVKNDGND